MFIHAMDNKLLGITDTPYLVVRLLMPWNLQQKITDTLDKSDFCYLASYLLYHMTNSSKE